MNVFIVIPAYNEEKHISAVITALKQKFANIIVIDDCSTDSTKKILQTLPVIFAQHTINLGQGAALQTGNEIALLHNADIIVHFDADGQHRIDQIDKLIQPIINGQADIVFGSRYLGSASEKKLIPWSKRVIILPIAKIVNWIITGLKLSDAHNGYRALSRNAAQKIKIYQNRMAHNSEITRQTKKLHLRFTEVPTQVDYSEYGQGIGGGFKILKDILFKNF